MNVRAAACVLVALLALGCDGCGRVAPAPVAEPGAAASDPAPAQAPTGAAFPVGPADPGGAAAARPTDGDAGAGIAPLEAGADFIDLDVPGHGQAVVAVPRGARERRPVLVATHGNFDRPEWQCSVWRGLVERPFVLCPRGLHRRDSPAADDPRFTYENNRALERETDAALAALAERFPAHADIDHPVLAGFSLGAIMAVAIAPRAGGRFRRLVLVEGGADRFTAASARDFAKAGGERVLFACGQPGCPAQARAAGKLLERAGVAARVVDSRNAGHRYDGPVADAIAPELGWLVEGDARWGQGE